jgi:hypothetical protein
VCIGQNEVILHFDNETSVMITTDVEVAVDTTATRFHDAPAAGTALTTLLGKSVDAVDIEPGGVTRLEWSSGAVIRLFDTSDAYESYVIKSGDRTIVV